MTRESPLTAAQHRMLKEIVRYQRTNGFPPTYRELAQGIGIGSKSTNAVNDVLQILERKGYIRRASMKSRTIVVLRTTAFLERELADEAAAARRCRVCGCTDADCSGCIERTGEPCTWVEPNLCSACTEARP